MKIPKWIPYEEQIASVGRNEWAVNRLVALSASLPIMEIPLDHLYVWHKYKDLTLREMVMHMKAVGDADLSCPIILDEDGEILDGRHRVMKAMLIGAETIKAVRFDENPSPCRIVDNAS